MYYLEDGCKLKKKLENIDELPLLTCFQKINVVALYKIKFQEKCSTEINDLSRNSLASYVKLYLR